MKRKKTRLQSVTEPPKVRMDAAGIDISPEEIYVAVDARLAEQSVRCFGTVTAELRRIADWLIACGVRTVAMESTGVYWIPLYQVLEARGLEVFLVNARHYKNVPGRKTDVCDAAWLQFLHAVGLVQGSFRPAGEICSLRSVLRHRSGLVESSSQHIQRMQKSLDQMNVQIHRVLSDLTGVSGLAIVDAILAGERDGHRLAALRDARVQASEEAIVKALEGDYREEHLFTLKQSRESYRHFQGQIVECDRQLREMVEKLEKQADRQEPAPAPHKKMRVSADEDLRQKFYRILGTDLTAVPSLNVRTVRGMIAEVGPDLSRFRSAGAFSSWVLICPNNVITGGKVISSHTREGTSRLGEALKMAAESLCRDKSYLGQFYRRMKAKHGPESAIVCAAHKLARIIYTLVTKRVAYDEGSFARIEQRNQEKLRQRLFKQARMLGYTMVPTNTEAVVS
ncbi:MAG TPA: IS110 family transposase [Terriglobales bacterium]|nr:IS110 family transposase [Terriglobales bacterium]